jgi:hypothetical protein
VRNERRPTTRHCAPPAEIAARAGHSVRILLTIYAHCIPGCDQIASQQIEQALHPSRWPPRLAHKNPRRLRGSRPPCVRATTGLNGTQLDPEPSTQVKLDVLDLRKGRLERLAHGSRPRAGRSWAPVLHKPLTSPDLAHSNREQSTSCPTRWRSWASRRTPSWYQRPAPAHPPHGPASGQRYRPYNVRTTPFAFRYRYGIKLLLRSRQATDSSICPHALGRIC